MVPELSKQKRESKEEWRTMIRRRRRRQLDDIDGWAMTKVGKDEAKEMKRRRRCFGVLGEMT